MIKETFKDPGLDSRLILADQFGRAAKVLEFYTNSVIKVIFSAIPEKYGSYRMQATPSVYPHRVNMS
jgi:hypothetical protein